MLPENNDQALEEDERLHHGKSFLENGRVVFWSRVDYIDFYRPPVASTSTVCGAGFLVKYELIGADVENYGPMKSGGVM